MARPALAAALVAVALWIAGGSALAQARPQDHTGARSAEAAAPTARFGDAADVDSAGIAMRRLLASRLSTRREPTTVGSVPAGVKFRLLEGFRLANQKLREESSCRGLFERFGVTGEAMLARATYASLGEVGACTRNAPAYTCVGCIRTVLCPIFARFEVPGAAALLLHEALHQAGQLERPAYPGAMSSMEITKAVVSNCRL